MKNIPLSPIEKSFYYQTKLNVNDDSGNIIHKVILDSTTSFSNVKSALCAIMSDHASLRYRLTEEDGVPYFYDSGVTEAEESASLESLKRPFDLQQDVLLRYIIDGNIVYIASHHIIFDAISWNMFIEQFLLLIDDRRASKIAQHQPVHKHVSANDNTAYWVDELSDIDRLVNVQRSSNSTKKRSAKVVGGILQSAIADKLRLYARSNKMSLNTIFMYAVSILLYRLTEQNEMVISTPISTREIDDMSIRCDINVLPCPIIIDSSTPVSEGLLDFSGAMWRNIEKRDFSLLDLTKSLGADGVDGLYNVMVEYSNKQTFPGIVSDTLIINKTPKMDIIVSVEDFNGDMTVAVEYDEAKVDRVFAEVVLNKIETVLNYIVSSDSARILDIELNSSQEIKDLLLLGQGKEVDQPKASIIDQFLRQVSSRGDATAIRQGSQECSYKELHDKSKTIASALYNVGVTSQSRVGVHMERSVEYIATMLAIWMLNAIYVPLDMNNPEERNKFFSKQSGVSTVVTNGVDVTFSNCTVVDIPSIGAKRLKAIASHDISVDDIAYIIFTSGSTGKPKGITIKHGGFLNHLYMMIDELSLSEDDAIAQTAPASFDISVWQLTCGLVVGATIDIVGHSLLIDPDSMYQVISSNNISVLEIVPSLLSAYLDAEGSDTSLSKGLSRVKVITTGEAITNDIARKWVNLYPEQPLINAYGPAEASDDTHFYHITHDSLYKHSVIPIGRASRNIHTYILDADQKLSPKGLVGEIAIGGLAVADGYVNDRIRTEAAFVEDTFLGTGKMYRTGDYGRWLPDGNLAFSGRRDNQVKIRGQRFELGEIENSLKDISGVKDAAAIIYDHSTNKRIIGFVSMDDKCKEDDLKSALSQKLPQYMIPWRIVNVDAIPRSNNGKVNRHELARFTKKLDSSKENTKNNSLLSVIISVYSEVLKYDVNAHTNYFEAGGDSLLSIKVASRLKSQGLSVSVRDIIANQTPFELAQVAKVSEADDDSVCIPDNFMSAIQQKYITESGNFVNYGEVQTAVLRNKKLTINNIPKILEKIHNAYQQLNMIKLTELQEVCSYDEIDALIEKYRTKLKLHDCMAISAPIRVGSELGILFIIHHYIFDVYSWDILYRDINLLLNNQSIPVRNDTKLLRYFLKQYACNATSLDGSNVSIGKHTTERHSFRLAAPKSIKLADDGMLSLYAAARAIMRSLGKNILHFGIEHSVRVESRDCDLSDTIGWATYIKSVNLYEDDSFNVFQKKLNRDNTEGYCADDVSIVINYLGGVVHSSNNDIQIIESTIYKQIPFIEVDIRLNDGFLYFILQENIGMKDEAIAEISANIESVLTDYSTTDLLNEIQQSDLLERIKLRARRD